MVYQSQDTIPAAINDSNTITGYWTDKKRTTHGFVRAADGTITTFDVGVLGTNPTSINADGWIAGYFHDKHFTAHAFLRAPDGTITSFDAPAPCDDALAVGINKHNTIVGYCNSSSGNMIHGFVRQMDGTISIFDPPGSTETDPSSINDDGTIAGWFWTPIPISGFVRTASGEFTTFDIGDSITVYALGINLSGTTAGDYEDKNYHTSAFSRDTAGNVTNIDLGDFTIARSVNSIGEIVGSFGDGAGYHSFTQTPDGQVTVFDFPNASDTEAVSINKRGNFTGTYMQHKHTYGFFRKP